MEELLKEVIGEVEEIEGEEEETTCCLTEEELENDWVIDQLIAQGDPEPESEDEGLEHIKICSVTGHCYDERESDYPDCCQHHGDLREAEIAKKEAEEKDQTSKGE